MKPGQEKTVRLMMAWYVPNTKMHPGDLDPSEKERVDKDPLLKYHKPRYSSRFKNIAEVAAYWDGNYTDLRKKTKLFTDSFYKSTLPTEVVEAVAANLTILKSPTVLRQYDGRFWCWEGCGDYFGSCHGSCTHVWNYAQAVSHLFPNLERSLRDTEFNESQNADGHQMFRSNLPITRVVHNFHAASDGQLGGIMKVYREWRVSGDNEWLKSIYPKVQASLDYCIKTSGSDRHRCYTGAAS
ncbi:non-lysosomal glucosylceramidase [Mucilaginibacter humi]|uniref:non-lysosomal glucosylceramidase n=1 Tax=Mucilaginibacter humi TaxID=2732510 RepID=UPI0021CF93FA|nr:non-lysosomal glucosylceramidase [Mucilaginibacter humi]